VLQLYLGYKVYIKFFISLQRTGTFASSCYNVNTWITVTN
jgi:hypothetical protein